MAVDPRIREQMDEIFSQATGGRRKPREDEYEQWGGTGGYLTKRDIDGTGKTIDPWAGGEIDPYWKSRLTMHATGDYNGDGTTPGDANSNRARGRTLTQMPGLQMQLPQSDLAALRGVIGSQMPTPTQPNWSETSGITVGEQGDAMRSIPRVKEPVGPDPSASPKMTGGDVATQTPYASSRVQTALSGLQRGVHDAGDLDRQALLALMQRGGR